MLPRLNEPNLRLGNLRRFQQVCVQALTWTGVALAALLAWPPLHLEWLALLDIVALSFWTASPYKWLASMAVIACACVGTFYGAALHGHSADILRLLGFSLATVLVANLLQRLTQNIEDRKRAESALRKQEEEYRHMVDFVPACICVADAQGDIIYANKTAVAAVGKPVEQIIGKGWLDCLHPDSLSVVEREWPVCIQTKRPLDVKLLFRQVDGAYRWQHLSAVPWLDEKGDVTCWYMLGVEIHELVKAQEALETSKRELTKIVETLPVGIWCTAVDGKPTYLNRRLREHTGATLKQTQDFNWLQNVHPYDRETTAATFLHSIHTGNSYVMTHRLRIADGSFHWYEQRGEPFRDANGQIKRWYGVAIDVDERVRMEERLRETRANLARASHVATVAELSASIAHELNQPLTSVIANAQAGRRWLAATPPNVTEAARSIDMILRDARAAAETMQNIRALFKRESIKKSRTRVDEMVREAVRLVHEDSQRKKMPIECLFTQELPTVLADRIQIQQVLINLICNGIEAAEQAGRPPRLRIRVQPYLEDRLLIEVQDNGPGVADPVSIFDAFVTTKTTGMGIGLAISRSIAQAHGGQLWAENLADGGACFQLVLPTA
jgi:PAS domain S-box-containing protein